MIQWYPPFFSNSGKWKGFFFATERGNHPPAGKLEGGITLPNEEIRSSGASKKIRLYELDPGQKCPFLLIFRTPPTHSHHTQQFLLFLCQKHTFLKNCLKIPLPTEEADLAFIFKKKTKPRSGRISKISIQSLASSFPFEDSGGLALPWNNYII